MVSVIMRGTKRFCLNFAWKFTLSDSCCLLFAIKLINTPLYNNMCRSLCKNNELSRIVQAFECIM